MKLTNFRFKTWHFMLAFFLLIILINIIGIGDFYDESGIADSNLVELNQNTFADSISKGVCYVLFFTENSNLCNKMEQNLDLIAEKEEEAKFYKLDVDKYLGKYMENEISGVPTVLIYNDGREVERIMGVVPVSNLKMINKRIGGKNGKTKNIEE